MREIEITIRLPEELIDRVNAAGVRIEDTTDQIADVLEKEIKRHEANQYLQYVAERLAALSDSDELALKEIEAIMRDMEAARKANPLIEDEGTRRMLLTMEQLRSIEPPITLEEINEGIREVRAQRKYPA